MPSGQSAAGVPEKIMRFINLTLFSEKVLISNRCISGLMPNLIKKSWTDFNFYPLLFVKLNLYIQLNLSMYKDLYRTCFVIEQSAFKTK